MKQWNGRYHTVERGMQTNKLETWKSNKLKLNTFISYNVVQKHMTKFAAC
jgi:hypothetical protein